MFNKKAALITFGVVVWIVILILLMFYNFKVFQIVVAIALAFIVVNLIYFIVCGLI